MTGQNLLYYGDNLDVLRRYIKDETVDLVYLDPPFNSNATYNVLFSERDGSRAAAQIKAFEDTWQWDSEAARQWDETVTVGGMVGDALQAFWKVLGPSNMMAYLSMMAPRLVELRRTLKPTGSIYLHCDPNASHYLKILMDSVFGAQCFRNEIVWKRTSSHNDSKRFASIHDTLLYYSRGKSPIWNPLHSSHNQDYVSSHYSRFDVNGRRYRLDNIIRSASMGPRPNLVYAYKGFTPEWGWRTTLEKLQALDADRRIEWSKSGVPYLVRYLDEMPGPAMPSIWDDLPPVNSQAAERLGYPTQKPTALLERIIQASSNEGDSILDPFCGCGTTIVAAEKLNRKWIGIDVTYLAIALMKRRIADSFPNAPMPTVVGEPVSLPDAQALADEDKFQFQYWVVEKIVAHPVEHKKGADRGIDGRFSFFEGPQDRREVLLSVKGGETVNVAAVRDLVGTIQRENAAIGVLVVMKTPTRDMLKEAATAGFYESAAWGKKYPRLQILTVADLLEGKQVDCPPRQAPYKEAQWVKKEQAQLF